MPQFPVWNELCTWQQDLKMEKAKESLNIYIGGKAVGPILFPLVYLWRVSDFETHKSIETMHHIIMLYRG